MYGGCREESNLVSAEVEVRKLKLRFVVQIYRGHGPFWQGYQKGLAQTPGLTFVLQIVG